MLTGRRLTGRSGDNNARRAWPIKQSRQRLDSTLVGPALERPGNMSCLQNNRLVPHFPLSKCSEICDRCERKQHADLSAHHSHLQILRAFYVFQRRANWYRRAARSATHRWRGRFRLSRQGERNGTRGHCWTYSELGGFNQETRLRWRGLGQSLGH